MEGFTVKAMLHLLKVSAAVAAEKIKHPRRARRVFFTPFLLAVQNAHGVLLESRFAVAAHIEKAGRKIFSERFMILRAAAFTADGIDLKRDLL